MSVEVGGRASKLGDTYERRFATKLALQMLSGQFAWLRWEPVDANADGVDLEVQLVQAGRRGYQLKRQNASKGRWTVAELHAEKVLDYARRFLEEDPRAEFAFISSDPVIHLKDLSERARRDPESVATFLSAHVNSSVPRAEAYRDLLERWGLTDSESDHAIAFGLIKRMYFGVVLRDELAEPDLVCLAAGQLTGDPENAIAVLGKYLDDHIGQRLYPERVQAHLVERGHDPTDLAKSPRLVTSVSSLSDAFLTSLGEKLIGGSMIERAEVTDLVARLGAETPPRLVLVHGRAGCGKSAALHQLCTELRANAIPCLPLQLHVHRPAGTPYQFGTRDLGLPGSPANTLRSLAADRHAVLLLDQIDALRLTSQHSHAAWDSCVRIIAEALAVPAMTVVVACRSFDLDNDPNIQLWRDALRKKLGGSVETLTLGAFSATQVQDAIAHQGISPHELTVRTRELLRHPNTLALWCRLAKRGQPVHEFATATELMRTFVRSSKRDAAISHHVQDAEVQTVLDTLVAHMESSGSLSVAESVIAG